MASMTNGRSTWRTGLAGAVLIFLIAACGAAPAGPSGSAGSKPTVVVQSPANGAVVAVGQLVAVAGSANDTVGVDHVSLFADGVSVASTPAGTPAPTVPFSLNWLATPAGPHVLQVMAYRADGTASDPTLINVVVGGGGSGVSGSLVPPPPAGLPTLPPPPKPTKKPKPSMTPPPATTEPTVPASTTPTDTSTPTTAPTTAPTVAPATPPPPPATPTPTPVLTPGQFNTAPDDASSEPYQIYVNFDCRTGLCSTDVPAAALGTIWERVSGPTGDHTDGLFFAPQPNTSYKLQLTSCSDISGYVSWHIPNEDPSLVSGCGGWLVVTTGAQVTGPQLITVQYNFGPLQQQYNLYQFTVIQCMYANCGTS